MNNRPNVTANHYSEESIPYIVTFEVVTALRSIMIITVTSGLVLRNVYGKVRRSRADLYLILE